jgi:hypothetical protein
MNVFFAESGRRYGTRQVVAETAQKQIRMIDFKISVGEIESFFSGRRSIRRGTTAAVG